jgi:hypothetical protein
MVLILLGAPTLWPQTERQESNQGQFRLPFGLPRSMTPAARREQQNPKPQAPTVTFTFGTIDYPNGPQTVAQGINKKGEIVGSWGPDINDYRQGLPAYGFSLKGSSFKKIVYPGAPITVPFGVNSSGEIVGYYSLDPEDGSGHGFTLVGTTFATVDYPGAQYTQLAAINKKGQILTTVVFSGAFCAQSYLLQSGTFSPQILYPGSACTLASGINDAGEVVGTYSNDEVTWHGFTLVSGTFTTVDYPGATDTILSNLNNVGQIVGEWDTGGVDPYGNPLTHGFLLQSGTFTSFDSPYAGVSSTWAYGINDTGVIVGQTIDGNDYFLGFEATIGK